ncbi:MAG: nucleoside:proton symporter [Alphaproteobacteria bacterium]|nr:nucleoside:proton symporter [Alphaproteobacteria bacterium]
MLESLHSGLGAVGLLALTWLLSENRRATDVKALCVGMVVLVVVALALLKLPGAAAAFGALNDAVDALSRATQAGTAVVFGYVGGGPAPFAEVNPGRGFILAFQALPIILVISALTALLTHWRVLPVIVRAMACALERTLHVGGAVGLSTAANIFVGTVEAPLFIRPYIGRLTRSELYLVMVGGMAGIAGTVLVLYASLLRDAIPNAAGQLIIASILSAPSAIVISRLLVPETGTPTAGSFVPQPDTAGAMDAITKGTLDGLVLLLNIIALLVTFIALVALANAILGVLPDVLGAPITLQRAFGVVMAPVTWLMGIPWSEATTAGALMGTKTVINEFVAYLDLSQLPAGTLGERSRVIMTYALCGFANFSSVGIMIGGLAAMAPERRAEIVELGTKSILGGTLATCLNGAVVGVIW